MFKKRNIITGNPPSLTVMAESGEPKEIKSENHIRLLGANLLQNTSWKSHLVDGEKAALPALRSKLGSLIHISTQLPSKSRKL